MKKRWFQKLDNKGFSLIEVLVAFMILVMASQILPLGISFARKVSARTDQIEKARREIGMSLYEESSVVYGMVRMELRDGEVLEKLGMLYTGEDSATEIPIKIIWTEEPDWIEWAGE